MAGISVVGQNSMAAFHCVASYQNIREANHQQVMDSAEISNIKRILGLQQGKDYDNTKSLRYGHLMIMTDQDHNGSHTRGLLINFIHSFWPSLLKNPFVSAGVHHSNREGNTQDWTSSFILQYSRV